MASRVIKEGTIFVAKIVTGLARQRAEVRATYGDKATAVHNQSTIISLDVAGAFDNVGQAVIIKKLYKELCQDPIIRWLRSFILNITIRVKINHLVFRDLGVHRGVPQGSALGPILWNCSIEDIRKLVKPSPTLQLLAYADDLTIVSHDNEKPWRTQRLLDQIRSKGLEISQENSELLHIVGPGRRPKDQDLPEYYIAGRGIRQEEHLKILRIPINRFMELRIEDDNTNEKLAKAKKLLRFLRMHNIVFSTSEWKVLFESLLKSVLIYNFIPLMATDKARYVSHNMIQVLYHMETEDEITQKRLIAGVTNLNAPREQREDYITLEEIFLHGGVLTWATKTAKQLRAGRVDNSTNQSANQPSGPTDQMIRNQLDPALQYSVCRETPDKPGKLAWLLTNHRQDRKRPSHCTATLVLFTNIDQPCVLREERIQNATYGISYYNTLATIWKRCVDNEDTNIIIINQLDSALKALENLANRSDIVIRLRELIIASKTHIIPTDPKKISAILDKIKRQSNTPVDLKIIKYSWPQVALRKLGNIRTAAVNVIVEQRLNNQLNKTMKALCPSAACWAEIHLDRMPNHHHAYRTCQ